MPRAQIKAIVGDPITPKEALFIKYYLELGQKREAAQKAGYSPDNPKAAAATASRLLAKSNIKHEIERQSASIKVSTIASTAEILDYFTRVMRGEEKDAFGLEAPLSERTRAAVELAKRTIDIENKLASKDVDNQVKIVLDWDRSQIGVAVPQNMNQVE